MLPSAPMLLQDNVFVPFAQMLEALRGQLTKAAAYGEATGFDFEVLLAARLAPDMLPLSAQIRFVCNQADDALARLAGRDRVEWPEVTSLDDAVRLLDANVVRLREAATATVQPDDAMVVLELGKGRVFEMPVVEYVRSWLVPQFYFHLMTAYSIMRHNGVDLGKADYVPHVAAFLRRD